MQSVVPDSFWLKMCLASILNWSNFSHCILRCAPFLVCKSQRGNTMDLELNTVRYPCYKSKNSSPFYSVAVIIFDVGKCGGRLWSKAIWITSSSVQPALNVLTFPLQLVKREIMISVTLQGNLSLFVISVQGIFFLGSASTRTQCKSKSSKSLQSPNGQRN